MQIRDSARKHYAERGITDDDVLHAINNAIRYVEQEYDGETRLLVIGADPTSRLLELVVIDDEEGARVIHADVLRKKFLDYLNM